MIFRVASTPHSRLPHREKQPVRAKYGWFIGLLIVLLALGACTRARPTPEPVATPDTAAPAAQDSAASDAAGQEPPVVEMAATPDVAEELDGTPEPDEEEIGIQETFQYIVEDGDTLSTVAEDFETSMDTLRQLNNLFSDEIQIGQPLIVPFKEGLIIPGMPTPTPGPFTYSVQQGDTMGSIAVDFGIDMIELIEANGQINPDSLLVGQEILIPGYQPQAPAASSGSSAGTSASGSQSGDAGSATHVVQQGETLSDIATLYGVDEGELVRLNNIANRNQLRAGQVLLLPGLTPLDVAALRGQVHVVQSGESLSQIAALYGKTMDELVEINGLANPDAIYVGQELVVPE